jgi:hypothetical protein
LLGSVLMEIRNQGGVAAVRCGREMILTMFGELE